MYEEAETFMILKYGSVAEAYKAWRELTANEQFESFGTVEYEILMEYEYHSQFGGPGPFDPR